MKEIIEKVKIDNRVELEFNLTEETVVIDTPNGRRTVPIDSLATIPDGACEGERVETESLLKAKEEAQNILRLIKTFPNKEELLNAVRRTRHPKNEAEKRKREVLEAYKFTMGMDESANKCIEEIRDEGNVTAFMEAVSSFNPYIEEYGSALMPIISSTGIKTTEELSDVIGNAKAQNLVSVTKGIITKFKIISDHMVKVKRRLE